MWSIPSELKWDCSLAENSWYCKKYFVCINCQKLNFFQFEWQNWKFNIKQKLAFSSRESKNVFPRKQWISINNQFGFSKVLFIDNGLQGSQSGRDRTCFLATLFVFFFVRNFESWTASSVKSSAVPVKLKI